MAHPQHGTRPLARKQMISAAIPKTLGNPELQLYKLQCTIKVQGANNATERAAALERLTGSAWTIARL